MPQCDVPNADLPEHIKNLKTAAPLAAMLSALIRKLPVLSGIPNGKKAVQKLRYSGSGSLERSGEADPLPLWIYGLVVLLGAILAAIFYLY